MNFSIFFMSLTIVFVSTSPLLAVSRSEQSVMSGSTACQAKVLSKNSLVMPSHCLENDQALIIEDFGLRPIARVHGKSRQARDVETLITVELRENIFPHFEYLKFNAPAIGAAVIRSNGIQHSCQVLSVDQPTKTFTHNCAQFQGQSGSAIYQKGELIGLHLGQLIKSSTYIAAMQNGPDFSRNPKLFESYQPQGLKVSCCKKLAKAVDDVGNAIADGAEAIKDFSEKAVENVKAEIGRVSKDIEVLPKVFSVEYVQNRLPEVKMPNLPKIEMSQSISSGNAFKWEMPSLKIPTCVYPKIDEDSVLGKIRTAVAKGFDDTGDALTKAGQDAKRWWPDTLKWLKDHARQSKPPKDCDDDASYDQLKTCVAGLESEIEDEERQLKKLRGGAKQWIDSQRSALGL